MSDLATRLYQAFSPAALQPDQKDLYVNLDQARGAADIVGRLAGGIRMSRTRTAQLVAGHAGSGKSTELLRLKQELEVPRSDRFFVVYFRADDDLDRNDVDFSEVLIAVVRQVAAQLRDRLKIRLSPGYFRDRLERLKQLLVTPVNFDQVELDAGLLTLGMSLKNSPNSRDAARRLLEPDTSNWLEAANKVLREATSRLAEKGYAGLVVLVDDLDKMIVRPLADSGLTTAEHLFVNRAPQMTGFDCHMVYTIPVTLTRQLTAQRLRGFYRGPTLIVPMTKLATPPPDSRPFAPGLQSFRHIISSRLQAVDADQKQVFRNAKARDELIRMSGGQPTALMDYMQRAIIDGLPIAAKSLRRIRLEEKRFYVAQLRREHYPIIDAIRQTGQFAPAGGEEPLFEDLLLSRAVLQYVNDTEWYGVNPAIADLELPA
jgi:hypothetical protein